ncbi:uncharacterized protein LOC131684703 [Topomyia yanbarensis]|uniref:uncharacterized protein LOC131684703 n=1 Tax=Topomyia yanbarensis TaxID=2498891 RepID=UPI00273ACD7D|nr:uncharacterized protein LOC131684703 [Topomyia yanbarensis]
MAGKGENVPDGYFYQLYTLLYCIYRLRLSGKRVTEYDIGCAIDGYGALDDVVFHAKYSDGISHTYALQVKQAKTDKIIDLNALEGDGNKNKNFYVFKYFKSFLDITKLSDNPVPLHQLKEMIVWTHMDFANNARDLMEKYSPDEADLLDPCDEDFTYERFRIKNYQQLARDYLRLTHPFEILVGKFVNVMFLKEEWNSKRAAKGCYRIMAKEVINCNEQHSTFRNEFVRGDTGLSPDTLLFRSYLERAIRNKFLDKNLGDFSIEQLNDESYKKHFQLKVDADFKEGTNKRDVSWKVGYVPVEQDLRDFFHRFIFYIKVPKLPTMKNFLARKFTVPFEQLCNLVEKCSLKKLTNNQQVDKIFTLLTLRETMENGIYSSMKFDQSDLLKLRKQLLEMDRFLYVEAVHDVGCSVSRIISIVEGDIEADKKRFIAINLSQLKNVLDSLLSIVNDPELCEHGLQFIIVSCYSGIPLQAIVHRLGLADIKVIFVADKLKGARLPTWSYFRDELDVGLLSQSSKDDVMLRKITFFGLPAVEAGALFSTELFSRENYRIVLELYRNNGVVKVGELLNVDNYFVPRLARDKSNKVVDLLDENGPARIIISDQTGMGKTTELVNVTVKLRERYREHLVVFMDFISAVDRFKTSLIDMVCKVVGGSSPLEGLIIKEMFQRKKVVLVMDALDEVSESRNEALIMLLKAVSNDVNKLYISTKPYCETQIIKILPDCAIYQMEPFSLKHQSIYLTNYWKVDAIEQEEERVRVEKNVEAVINKFRSIFRDNTLLGIPLQTKMVAEIYKEDIHKAEFEVPQAYEIGRVVKKFVKRKFQRFCSANFSSANKAHESIVADLLDTVVQNHVKLALHFFRPTLNADILEDINRNQMYGLVQLQPSVGFIHQIYLDYFLTLYMLTYSVNAGTFLFFMKKNLCTSRINIATRFLDFHIGCIDSDTPLKTDEFDSGLTFDPEQYKVPPTIRVHPDKIREFNYFLENHCTDSEIFTLIRNSFNSSVFNVFEVLYDSLPSGTKTNLKFRFGAQPENNFINLKLFGENQMLQLLPILRRKNPENFVRQYLIDFDDGEEDFLAVACRKPFLKVLQWIIELASNISAEENCQLQNYVCRRITRYLQLVLQHNNSQVLQIVIDWVMELGCQETIRAILEENNVLLEFSKNIAVKGETKSFLVDQRIEMIYSLYNLFQWVYDDNIILSEDCCDKIANAQNGEIQSAFNVTFLQHR